MTIQGLEDPKPITATDAEIEAALEDAHIPSLMCALVHITGDANLVREALRALRDGARLPAPPSQALAPHAGTARRHPRSARSQCGHQRGGSIEPAEVA